MAARMKYGTYRGESLNRVAFPLGGIGAGMVCLEGTGALSHVSLRHQPDVFNEPRIFAAVYVKGAATARVLEGPVPKWKAFGTPGAGTGKGNSTYGLPRFAQATFTTRFPFATIRLSDPAMPVTAQLTGWSPFTPGEPDDSSLPAAALEYRLTNRTDQPVSGVFSYHAFHFLALGQPETHQVRPTAGGFVLHQPAREDNPAAEASFAAIADDPGAIVDCGWFRGGWFDPMTMVWNAIASGETPARPPHSEGEPGPGASLYLPFALAPGASRTIVIRLTWHVPRSGLCQPPPAPVTAGAPPPPPANHVPWYAAHFAGIDEVAAHWAAHYRRLRTASQRFSRAFYDTTLPAELIDAAAANLTILKSPTVLRQADGRVWAWEGCTDTTGCCAGTCTHVWNYAQALPHLFPSLERTLRETEFAVSQDERGHQNFRAALPIRTPKHDFHAAADGQLGGIVKVYREWRISGDTDWLRGLWPLVRMSLDYCIATWDPDQTGTLREPHHNTYDIEFWGADGMCTSFYLAALQAAIAMGRACGSDVARYEALQARGRQAMETTLWNGEYFIQRVEWQQLRAGDPTVASAQSYGGKYSAEALVLLRREGPKYQYGSGCLSDGVLGDWLGRVSGLGPCVDPDKLRSHLRAVFRHNFKASLADHANPQRPSYALGDDAGLLLCSWPRGGKPALPFVYSDEVWTGIEYQVAAHLILMGELEAGCTIVRAVRKRHDGRFRNPFNEYECGHWYARAMASYALLGAAGGARYDAVEKTLYLAPAVKGDYRAFLATATGYATVGVREGQPFCQVRHGQVAVDRIVYTP